MKRVAIVGPSGAGKSTLARELGTILGIEPIYLDAHFWKPGWVQADNAEFDATVGELAKGESWIIDGNYSRTLDDRLKAADAVIFLDVPRREFMRNVLKRLWTCRGRSRPDMGQGCVEKVDLEFLRWAWDFPKKRRPELVAMLSRYRDEKPVYRLRSRADMRQFLDDVRLRHTSQARANR